LSDQEILIKAVSDFDFFVRKFLNAKPSNQQQEFIRAIQAAVDGKGKRDISIRSGHGAGKSSALSWLILWIGISQVDAKIPATAPVADQLTRLLIPECKKWHRQLPTQIQNKIEIQTESIKFEETQSVCFVRTARKENTEALAGVHASFVCFIIDEASGVDRDIFEVIDGALTGNYLLVMTGNMTRSVGAFYDSQFHHSKRLLYNRLHWDSEKSSNVTPDWIAKMQNKYKDDASAYGVRVKGEAPLTDTDAVFNVKLITDANQRENYTTEGVYTYSIDVARFGGDSSVFSKREGQEIYGYKSFSGMSLTELGGKIANIYNTDIKRPNAVFVDADGLGAGLVDILRAYGLQNIIEVHGNAEPTKEEYVNKRAEMYFGLKKFLETGKLLEDNNLTEELLATTYSYTPAGKIKLPPKKDIKDEVGRSPDRADSVAMHFFMQIIPASVQEIVNSEYYLSNSLERTAGW
jgi:phage terminase large subunit